ncbi:MAG: transglutaminase domain-containing protein [Oscillospiraceae bacterium]
MKLIKSFILPLLCVFLLSSCSMDETVGKIIPMQEKPPVLLSDEVIAPAVSRFAFNNLNDDEKQTYREICTAILNQDEKIKLTTLDKDTVEKPFQAVFSDHPEIFYIDGYQIKSFGTENAVSYIQFFPSYTQNADEISWRKEKIDSVASGIVGQAQGLGDDYQKAKFVYEYVIKNTDYSADAPDSQNVYSVFNNHKSVCAGYARSVQLLLNRLGIECTYVIGSDLENNSHAWNFVKLDGEYYHMDATFGDPVFSNGKIAEGFTETDEGEPSTEEVANIPNVFYEPFAMTDEVALKSRIISEGQNLPPATATADSYYVREGNFFETYSTELLLPCLERALENKQNYVTFQMANDEGYQTALRALFVEMDMTTMVDTCQKDGYFMVNKESVTYFKNDETRTLTIMLY